MYQFEEKELLVNEKSKAPRCFRSFHVLPVSYIANKEAWISSEILEWEIRNWIKVLQKQNRNTPLVISNWPAHPAIEIKINFFSTQPRKQSIIACPTRQYRKMVVGGLIFYLDGPKTFYFNSFDAILSVNTVWNRVSEKLLSTAINMQN